MNPSKWTLLPDASTRHFRQVNERLYFTWDVRLKPMTRSLVVTAGFLRVELGPDLLREVRGTSGSRCWRSGLCMRTGLIYDRRSVMSYDGFLILFVENTY